MENMNAKPQMPVESSIHKAVTAVMDEAVDTSAYVQRVVDKMVGSEVAGTVSGISNERTIPQMLDEISQRLSRITENVHRL